MSWDPVTYWTLRCDGSTRTGQCEALLRTAEPADSPYGWDSERAPYGWTPEGYRVNLPVLFTEKPWQAALRSEPKRGWLATRDRVLCPEHAAAQEYLAAAAVDGLPLDEST